MKLVVGLGNPGPEYMGTRHNAGVLFVEKLGTVVSSPYGWRRDGKVWKQEGDGWVLVRTATMFMNESGTEVGRIFRQTNLKPEDLIVVHDDLDIALGDYKIHMGRGPKEHNGVTSVETALGTKDFWRVRLGIENRTQKVSGEDYVLSSWTKDEREKIERTIDTAIHELMHGGGV